MDMDWGFIVFVGTMLFFAALHQWPPDGRRWEREKPIREANDSDVAQPFQGRTPRG